LQEGLVCEGRGRGHMAHTCKLGLGGWVVVGR
jgi:hypothetical protein